VRMLRIVGALAATAGMTACLSFGPNAATTTPTAEQVARCRAEMYLAPDLKLAPKGFKLIQGIDAAIWFKFVTPRQPFAQIFRAEIVDTARFKVLGGMADSHAPSWWDVNGKRLVGGSVSLPNVRSMWVAIEEGDEQLTVYVSWHET
jgi:hypothetical protein